MFRTEVLRPEQQRIRVAS